MKIGRVFLNLGNIYGEFLRGDCGVLVEFRRWLLRRVVSLNFFEVFVVFVRDGVLGWGFGMVMFFLVIFRVGFMFSI